MKDNDQRYYEFERAVEIKNKQKETGKRIALLNKYRSRINNGDWRFIVPEFEKYDAFDKYKERIGEEIPEWGEKTSTKELDELAPKKEDRSVNKVTKRTVEIRLRKNDNEACVKVEEIDGEEEFEYQKDWALSQARQIWSKFPSENIQGRQTTKEGFDQNVKREEAQRGVKFQPMTKEARGYGTEKQWEILRGNIDKIENHPQFSPGSITNYQDLHSAVKYIIKN